MYIGIDLSGDVLRYCMQSDSDRTEDAICGLCGIPPRFPRERFLWNYPQAARCSERVAALALGTAWQSFLANDKQVLNWTLQNGVTNQESMAAMIAGALSQNLPGSRQSPCAIGVSNYFSEPHQDCLLEALHYSGISDTALLWRPIAIAMSFLDSSGDRFSPGQRLLIVDAECCPPEVTEIELVEHETGEVLPLRKKPVAFGRIEVNSDIFQIRRKIAAEIAYGDREIAEQLCAGTFAKEFIAATEMKPHGTIWGRKNNRFQKILADENTLKNRIRENFRNEFLPKLIQGVKEKFDVTTSSAILWHGWPFRVMNRSSMNGKNIILDEYAVCRGAALYTMKLAKSLPTYMDTLPGLYILSHVQELDTYCFFHLIKPSVIPGGQSLERAEPLTRFSVRQGLQEFTAVLRKSDETHCRKVITRLPHVPEQDAPVLIRAEARPASGYAQVTIEGVDGYKDVFGKHQRVKLNWDSMESVAIPFVCAPEVYPVRGRLFDQDDPEYMRILLEFLDRPAAGVYDKITYRGHEVNFYSLLEPWGLSPPWHTGRGQPTGWQTQPARGMFGSMVLPVEPSVLDRLAQRIRKVMHQDRVKFFSYMFVYAPPAFKEELREKFRQPCPSFTERVLRGRPRPSWNWGIAPGRVFSTAADFELFVDFMIRHGQDRYPKYPDDSFTIHYWWSFFRCLCYHADTINIAPEKIYAVLRMIHAYIAEGNADQKALKYCLCAILFSLRIRHLHPDFLQPVDAFCEILMQMIAKKMPKIPYPSTMLAVAQDPHGGGLNGLVLRFLMQTADADDCRAIEGLTTSMA